MSVYKDLVEGREKLAVIGLGYVGMPLLFAFAQHLSVIGFDIADEKVALCKLGPGSRPRLKDVNGNAAIACTGDPAALSEANFIIIAVPTPIHHDNTPDMTILKAASELAGKNMKPGTIISYESTVYPGATEEVCIPILEKASGLKAGVDFKVGYSPERINPGDKVNKLETIVKIVSGMDTETADALQQVYSLVAKGGIHRASSMKVAEAAKVAENSQRDVNIAFVNELAMMFHLMDIDTLEVIEAMDSKWNALGFRPGLVGGHCISVDPFYLTHKAEELGYHPGIIHAGRKLNDSMGRFVGEETVKMLSRINKPLRKIKLAVLGFSFKENSDDTRNTKVEDIVSTLEAYGINPLICDQNANAWDVTTAYHRTLSDIDQVRDLDCLIIAVAHDEYRSYDAARWAQLFGENTQRVLVDVKGVITPEIREALDCNYWRL